MFGAQSPHSTPLLPSPLSAKFLSFPHPPHPSSSSNGASHLPPRAPLSPPQRQTLARPLAVPTPSRAPALRRATCRGRLLLVPRRAVPGLPAAPMRRPPPRRGRSGILYVREDRHRRGAEARPAAALAGRPGGPRHARAPRGVRARGPPRAPRPRRLQPPPARRGGRGRQGRRAVEQAGGDAGGGRGLGRRDRRVP